MTDLHVINKQDIDLASYVYIHCIAMYSTHLIGFCFRVLISYVANLNLNPQLNLSECEYKRSQC